jgi:hypothetical protein
MALKTTALALIAMGTVLVAACGGSDSEFDTSSGGTGGTKDSGTDASGGTGGDTDGSSDASGGAAGAAGGGGTAGVAGTGGSAGAAGTGGGAGASSGGSAGAGGCTCDCDGDSHLKKGGSCGGDDCDDNDANVFPGQTSYFDQPAKNGGFDYDCSGSAEQESSQTISCTVALCPTTQGYFASPPACGQSADWGVCSGALCQKQVLEQKKQACH